MSDTSGQIDPDRSVGQRPGESQVPEPARRKRRGLRITLVSLASLVVFLGAVAAGGYLSVNHLADGIRRTPVKVTKPVAGKATTTLITGSDIGPTGLIMLLHVSADGRAGGVVSILPETIVPVPGHGQTQINNALVYGGPSMLVQTVEQLTHVSINHYAQVNLTRVSNVINAVGGVNVTLPETTKAFGHTFPAGVNHLDGRTAIYYARQPSLTEEGRVLRQQSLFRAVAYKLANAHLLNNPIMLYRVIDGFSSSLTVDAAFTNSDVVKCANQFRPMNSRSGVFLMAPTYTVAGKTYLNSFPG
jgi:LCP family protein required for cell wall assembly